MGVGDPDEGPDGLYVFGGHGAGGVEVGELCERGDKGAALDGEVKEGRDADGELKPFEGERDDLGRV